MIGKTAYEKAIKDLLRTYSEGLTLYSIYIKLRFSISLTDLTNILENDSEYIQVNNRFVSKDIERKTASLSFYVKYYNTRDIITLHCTGINSVHNRELSYEELINQIEFITTQDNIIKKASLPEDLIKYISNVNTVFSPYEFTDFIIKILPSLKKWGKIIIDDSFTALDIKDESIIPTFYVDYEKNTSFLYLYPKYFVGKELIDITEISNIRPNEFIRKNNSFRRVEIGIRDRFASLIKSLDLTLDNLYEQKNNAMRYKLENFKFTLLSEIESNKELHFVYSQSATNFIDNLNDFNSIEDVNLPIALENSLSKSNIKLRQYQRIGINWLNYLRTSNLNGLIADDMGLGKTIQVISVLACAYENENIQNPIPSIVICPKSVIVVWKEQLHKYYPSIRVGIVLGKRNIDDYLKSATATNRIILLTTYETVSHRKESFHQYSFLYLILDEAQKIKNPQTSIAKAIKNINATHKIAMTGTPIENHLSELWSIFDFIMHGYLGSYDNFKTKYQKPIIDGNNAIVRLLKKKIDPFKIRRTKKQKDTETGKTIINLPELTIDDIKIHLNKEQTKLYRKILSSQETKDVKKKLEQGEKISNLSLNIFAILTRLKQVCNHPLLLPKDFLIGIDDVENIKSEKFEALIEKIGEIIESEQKVVIFSQYTEMLNIIENYLTQKQIGFSKIIGGMSQHSRETNITRFQEDPNNKYPVFLASLKAGGVGISLTSASNVIHYDRWWNPAVENQATDRVYRSGNNSTIVNVYKFVSLNTIEEKINWIMKKKQNLLESIIEEDDLTISKSFTREELIELLSDMD